MQCGRKEELFILEGMSGVASLNKHREKRYFLEYPAKTSQDDAQPVATADKVNTTNMADMAVPLRDDAKLQHVKRLVALYLALRGKLMIRLLQAHVQHMHLFVCMAAWPTAPGGELRPDDTEVESKNLLQKRSVHLCSLK